MCHRVSPLLVLAGVLLSGAATAVAQEQANLSVSQDLANAFEASNSATTDLCTKDHPELKADFDTATAKLRPRVISTIRLLLETEQFRSLSKADAPKLLVGASANSTALLRASSSRMSLNDCKIMISDMETMSDELLRGVLTQMLVSTAALVDMEKRAERK